MQYKKKHIINKHTINTTQSLQWNGIKNAAEPSYSDIQGNRTFYHYKRVYHFYSTYVHVCNNNLRRKKIGNVITIRRYNTTSRFYCSNTDLYIASKWNF